MSDNSVGTNQPETKKTGSSKVIILIGVAIIILLLVVIVILLLRKPTGSESTSSPAQADQEPKREVLVNEDNVEEVAKKLEEETANYVEPGRYAAVMNYDWHFATGDSESYDSYVANVEENTNDVYFDIFLKGEEEAIYESPILPRGSQIKNIRLNRDLDAGTYESVLVYHLVDENQNSLSTASFKVRLIIEN